ncbi:MAG TPA: nucleotidyltransferase domain-containing protein [Longimicrobium sp.]
MKASSQHASTLAALFPSMAMARLVVFFAVHPGGRFHLRELKRLTRLSSASLQHELRRLARIGALRREEEGARAVFSADESHPAWRAWMLLLRSGASPADVLREALVDAEGLEGAFVFGSWARGDARPDSDVDVFLIGSDDARLRAGRSLSEAELLVGRELDVIGYDAEQLARRVRSGNAFVRRVLAGPMEWVRGGPEALTETCSV